MSNPNIVKMETSEKSLLIAQMREYLADRRYLGRLIFEANFKDRAKRNRITLRNREKLFENVFEKIGVSEKKIKALQKSDEKSIEKSLNRIKKLIGERSEERQNKHLARVKQIQELKEIFERKTGNPVTTVCLWFADTIDINNPQITNEGGNYNSSNPSIISGNVGENKITHQVSVRSPKNGSISYVQSIDFHFVWNSNLTGIMNATSWMYHDGTYGLFCNPTCWGTSIASALLRCSMTVGQLDLNNQLIVWPSSNITSRTIGDGYFLGSSWNQGMIGSNGTDNVTKLDEETTLNTLSPFPIRSNRPVIVTVTATLDLFTISRARATLDFGNGINIPSVWLIIES